MGEIWGKTDMLSNFGLSMIIYVKIGGERPSRKLSESRSSTCQQSSKHNLLADLKTMKSSVSFKFKLKSHVFQAFGIYRRSKIIFPSLVLPL